MCDAVCGDCGETFVVESDPLDILDGGGAGRKDMFVKAGVPCIVIVVAAVIAVLAVYLINRKRHCLHRRGKDDVGTCETDEEQSISDGRGEEEEEEAREETGQEEEGSQSPSSGSHGSADTN